MILFKPFRDVSGGSPFWHADSGEPWFEILVDLPVQGGWLELGWDSSLSQAVCRPQLRFEMGDAASVPAEAYSVLAGAPLGRQEAVVFVPPGTTRLLISPHDRRGRFAFRLTKACWIGLAGAIAAATIRRPFVAAHALGAALIGRPDDFRLLLMEALNAVPLSRYAAWRRRKSRLPDWSSFDAFPVQGLPQLHVLGEQGSESASPSALPAGISVRFRPLPNAAAGYGGECDRAILDQIASLSGDDLVMFMPRDAQLCETAVPALLLEAAADPELAFVYGDEAQFSSPDNVELRVHSGFDSLSTFRLLSTSSAVAFRIGKVRSLLSGMGKDEPWRGQPLWRPLVTIRKQGQPVPISSRILAGLASGWRSTHRDTAAPITDLAVIIPTRDRLPLLRACLDSVRPTLPPGSELIIVDNDSCERATIEFLDKLSQQDGCRVLRIPGPFNFSRLCNQGAAETRKPVLVFLNNDTTILAKNWLEILGKWATQPDIGAVGARLLYPSGRVQHSGVIIGIGGFAGHIDLNAEAESSGTFGRAHLTHTLSAVTGACLAVEREKFDQVGGFDEIHLPIELNDIDLCLRLGERGWRTVFAAEAVLVHHESASRGRGGSPDRYRAEKAYFSERWKGVRRGDPFWHPALSLLSNKGMLG